MPESLELPEMPAKLTLSAARYAHYRSRDQALFKYAHDPLLNEAIQLIARAARLPAYDIGKLRQALMQMMHARAIDTFQVYYADAAEEVLNSQPQLISEEATLRIADLARAPSLRVMKREATNRAIRKKVDALAHAGFFEFARWFATQGVKLPLRSSDRADLSEWLATRNIIIHNHGLVNSRYLSDVPASDYKLGDERYMIFNDIARMQRRLATVVFASDQTIAAKFKLKTRSRKAWSKQFPIMSLPPDPD
jgi:hypothetical protein